MRQNVVFRVAASLAAPPPPDIGGFRDGTRLAWGSPPMPTSRKTESPPIYVTVVSDNPETLDGLRSYFEQSGVASHCTRAANDLGMVAPDRATATVIFPDDFADATVLSL